MPEPITLIIMGAAVGGAAGKFTEKAYDTGERWLKEFFKGHGEKAQMKAGENSAVFLNELAKRVKELEEGKNVTPDKIENALNHPSFSALLQKALLTAAQTDEKVTHDVLARLVSERLANEPESIHSLVSKMACDAMAYMSGNQLKILGLLSHINLLRPIGFPSIDLLPENYQGWANQYIISKLYPFLDVEVLTWDLLHLSSLSCIEINHYGGPRDLGTQFSYGSLIYKFDDLPDHVLRDKMKHIWEIQQLKVYALSSIGMLVGIYVSDNIHDDNTDLTEFFSHKK